MHHKQQLIVFTRFPDPGKTKTRLIPHLGAEGAALFQKEMTEYTVKQARRSEASVEVRYTGGSLEQMHEWLGDDLQYAEQGEGDLGERMRRAFEDHFNQGAARVVIIGSDCPSNEWKNMQQSFQALENTDCVIGPANDGGYYLIGLRKGRDLCPRAPRTAETAVPTHIFQNIDWGGDQVLEQTLKAASGISIVELKLLHDVDLPEDIPQKISVIIPSLNEETHIFQTLKKAREGFNVEAIVVDGGSMDGTQEKAEPLSHFMKCDYGRAAQQNLGAEETTGEILLFLHADTLLPDDWDWIVRDTLSDPAVAAGAFTFRIKEQMHGLKFIEDTANWRSRVWKLPFGDQGLFMRRETFEAVGGFPDMPIMEDYELVRRLRRKGKIVTVPQAVFTSGRRWQQHGVFKVTAINKLMILGYRLGIPPRRLARMYRGKN